MKKMAIVSLLLLAVFLFGSTNVRADSAATTHWRVYAWIGQTVVDGVLTMTTTGAKVVGKFRDNQITGDMVQDGAQLNGNWTGPRGAGWITLHVHNGGNGFGGEWGQKGKPADGKFVGTLITNSSTSSSSQ